MNLYSFIISPCLIRLLQRIKQLTLKNISEFLRPSLFAFFHIFSKWSLACSFHLKLTNRRLPGTVEPSGEIVKSDGLIPATFKHSWCYYWCWYLWMHSYDIDYFCIAIRLHHCKPRHHYWLPITCAFLPVAYWAFQVVETYISNALLWHVTPASLLWVFRSCVKTVVLFIVVISVTRLTWHSSTARFLALCLELETAFHCT